MSDIPVFRSATFELRDDTGEGMPTMVINFARFNEWTEINSMWEGRFMERFAPGAFKKTIRERGDKIRALFQHGQDPNIGKKPIGSIVDLREEADGAWADIDLLDTDYVRELLPGIRAGLYGASMAFMPIKSKRDEQPSGAGHNPHGIPEETVMEAALREFGPVTFPAYENTSAGVRSITDDLLLDRLLIEQPDRLREMLEARGTTSPDDPEQEPPVEGTPLLAVARRRHDLQGRRWRLEPGAAHSA